MPSLCSTLAWAARHDRTVEVVLRSAQSKTWANSLPVGFFAQIGLLRFRAGDDHAVKPVVPQIVEGEIKAIQMPLAAIGAGNSGQRVQLDERQECRLRQCREVQRTAIRCLPAPGPACC